MPLRTKVLAAFALLASVAFVSAQSGRSYGPDRVWWDAGTGGTLPLEEEYDTPDGRVSILNANGLVHTEHHAFFTSLGTNGRACVTCHQPSNAMSVSTRSLRERWNETNGKDPVFAAIDGSNCPDLPQAAESTHSLLLNRGLFRIFLPWPPKMSSDKPEFRLEVVQDPTGCNTSAVYGLNSPNPTLSVYRRPRVVANFKYVIGNLAKANLMSDARESSLQGQAITAVFAHEQATEHPSIEQLRQIVEFENQVYVAQTTNILGGRLNEREGPAGLGPENLANGKAGPLNPNWFEAWSKPASKEDSVVQSDFRASVARGSDLFFKREFQNMVKSSNVTCATCHAPSATRWMDIGTSNRATAKDSTELPLFKITCYNTVPPHPVLGRVIYTNDPGRALISGKCADVGAMVMQQFRGLSARAPYFANGSAATLREVIEFYDRRFEMKYTEQEKQDLVNFLSVL